MAELETQEDKISHIGWGIVNSVPLRGMETAAPYMSPAEDYLKNECPTQHIRPRSKTTETLYQLAYQTRDCIVKLQQWQQMSAFMERGEMWQLEQRESSKHYNENFTPLPIDIRELYCKLVMFSLFFCALMSFRVREFPEKSETQEPSKIIMECTLYANLY